jgi:hypothetical protein
MSPANGYHLIQLAIGEAPAYQIAKLVFGMCSDEAWLEDKDDRKIGNAKSQCAGGDHSTQRHLARAACPYRIGICPRICAHEPIVRRQPR